MKRESLCWLFEVKPTAVRPPREKEREHFTEKQKDVIGFARSVSILSLSLSLFSFLSPFSSLLFQIQLSSKALYWHDCPKLTIQLEGFTLQSRFCRLSLSRNIFLIPTAVSPVVSHLLRLWPFSPLLSYTPFPSLWPTMAEVACSAYWPREKQRYRLS